MKKVVLVLIMGLGVLAACEKEEVTQINENQGIKELQYTVRTSIPITQELIDFDAKLGTFAQKEGANLGVIVSKYTDPENNNWIAYSGVDDNGDLQVDTLFGCSCYWDHWDSTGDDYWPYTVWRWSQDRVNP